MTSTTKTGKRPEASRKKASATPSKSGEGQTRAPKVIRTALTPASLERFRIERGMTAHDGAAVFGVPIAKWYDMTFRDNIKDPLDDVALAMLYTLYTEHPQSAPKAPPSIGKFYAYLGFAETREDKAEFARLIGRQYPSAYRLLDGGKPSRPLVRYIEALQQLNLSGRQTRRVMEQVAEVAYTSDQGEA